MLTAEGISYAKDVAASYRKEYQMLQNHLKQDRHTIPFDVVSLKHQKILWSKAMNLAGSAH